jgi:hypothetical protein
VQHPLFESWKQNTQPLQHYDFTYGWFTSEDLDASRLLVERALHSMLTIEESRSLASIEKEQCTAADGRKGRRYISSLQRRDRRRSQMSKSIQIKALAALAPLAASADSVAARGGATQSSSASAVAALDSSNIKPSVHQHSASRASSAVPNGWFDPSSSQSSRAEVMSQLSSACACFLR